MMIRLPVSIARIKQRISKDWIAMLYLLKSIEFLPSICQRQIRSGRIRYSYHYVNPRWIKSRKYLFDLDGLQQLKIRNNG
jgi:hypothetical protein